MSESATPRQFYYVFISTFGTWIFTCMLIVPFIIWLWHVIRNEMKYGAVVPHVFGQNCTCYADFDIGSLGLCISALRLGFDCLEPFVQSELFDNN